MAETIVIKKDYFTNIETAVNAINKFFQTNYQEKDFPVIDGFSDMDPTIKRILDSLNSVEPSWIDDTSKVDNTINEINDAARTVDVDNPDEVVVTEKSEGKNIVLELHVAASDMGKVIGKQGRIAKAIRSVVKAAASKEDKKVIVEIMQ